MDTHVTIFFIFVAFVIVFQVFRLLRSRRLREKYAALWLVVGIVSILLALFPPLLAAFARLVGIEVPANLLFVLAIMLLLGVCLQLSQEISRLEAKVRVLAEHVALINVRDDIDASKTIDDEKD